MLLSNKSDIFYSLFEGAALLESLLRRHGAGIWAASAAVSAAAAAAAAGGKWRSIWPPSSAPRKTKSTVHFISKLEHVVMETGALGCTINRRLARPLPS